MTFSSSPHINASAWSIAGRRRKLFFLSSCHSFIFPPWNIFSMLSLSNFSFPPDLWVSSVFPFKILKDKKLIRHLRLNMQGTWVYLEIAASQHQAASLIPPVVQLSTFLFALYQFLEVSPLFFTSYLCASPLHLGLLEYVDIGMLLEALLLLLWLPPPPPPLSRLIRVFR